MSTTNRVESILVLDVGNALTKADLFDVVDGHRRFLARGCAPTSISTPEPNVVGGVVGAIRQLESIAGRPVLGHNGLLIPERSDGTGVDDCFLVTSVNSTLRVLVVGATVARANEVAAEVAGCPAARVVATVALAVEKQPVESRMARIIEALHDEQPDILVAAADGTTQNEVVELAQCLGVSARTRQSGISIVLAGTEEAAAPLRQTLPESTRLFVIPCKSNAAGTTPLQDRLHALWHEHWLQSVPGSAELRDYGFGLPRTAQDGFASALRFVAACENLDIWAVGVGAHTSCAVCVVDGAHTVAAIDIGLGSGSAPMLEAVNNVAQWRPLVAREAMSIADGIFHKTLHPYAIPETPDELAQEYALCTEIASKAISALSSRSSKYSQSSPLLVAAGAPFAHDTSIARVALLMLNAFQPVGLVGLAVDRLGILAGLGVIAQRHPEAAAELVLREGLQRLGSCLGMGGSLKQDGSLAVSVDLRGGGAKMRKQVAFGNIERIPLPVDAAVQLTVKPAGKLDAGHGLGRKCGYAVKGNRLGLIVDARGRPLDLTRIEEQRRLARLAEWQRALEV